MRPQLPVGTPVVSISSETLLSPAVSSVYVQAFPFWNDVHDVELTFLDASVLTLPLGTLNCGENDWAACESSHCR